MQLIRNCNTCQEITNKNYVKLTISVFPKNSMILAKKKFVDLTSNVQDVKKRQSTLGQKI